MFPEKFCAASAALLSNEEYLNSPYYGSDVRPTPEARCYAISSERL